MQLGYVTLTGRGQTDACLAAVVADLTTTGLSLAGTVQINCDQPEGLHCDMDLQVLPDGPLLRISQNLGPGSTGCRLDAGALETAVAAVEVRLDGAALLVVNKFGKQEALGRGFAPLIGEALSRGMPVLLGVNGLNLQAFLDFAGELATPLPPDPRAVSAWVRSACLTRAA